MPSSRTTAGRRARRRRKSRRDDGETGTARRSPGLALRRAADAGRRPRRKKELVQKMLLLQQPAIENIARSIVERPAAQLMQAAGQALQRQVPADKREAVGKAIAGRRQEVTSTRPIRCCASARSSWPRRRSAPALEEKFSEDELKQLIAWLESPVNKKFQQLGPSPQHASCRRLVAECGAAARSEAAARSTAGSAPCLRRAAGEPGRRRRPRPAGAAAGCPPPWRAASSSRPNPIRMASTAPDPADLPALREQIDARRSRTAGAAEPPRRRWRRQVGELKKREGSLGLSARARGAGHRRPEGRQPGPAAERQRGADLARDHVGLPRARDAARASPTSGPAGTFSEQAALGYLRLVDRAACPAPASTRCSAPPAAGAADFGVVPVENSTEGVVTRSLDLFLTTPLIIIGETSLFVRHNLLRQDELARGHRGGLRAPAGAGAVPRLAEPTTCPTPSAGRWRATPRARAWRRSTRRWPASPASARPASSACTWSRRRSRTTPHNRTRFADRRPPRAPSAAAGVGPRLHQPRGLGDQPAGRGARHAGAAEGARRVDDALRVAPGALGPVGVLLLHRPRRATPTQPHVAAALQELRERLRVLQAARHLSRSTSTDSAADGSRCSTNSA